MRTGSNGVSQLVGRDPKSGSRSRFDWAKAFFSSSLFSFKKRDFKIVHILREIVGHLFFQDTQFKSVISIIYLLHMIESELAF